MGLFETIFGKPKHLLKAPSLEESKKECAEINATPKEIKEAKKMVRYICTKCGYHSGIVRRCSACGGWLRYWRLAERIRENREIEEESE